MYIVKESVHFYCVIMLYNTCCILLTAKICFNEPLLVGEMFLCD